MNRLTVLTVWLAVLAVAAGVRAQQTPPTFSARTTLLTLDVTTLDRDGKPVPGLGPDDFEVKVNGKVQRVQTVAYLEAPRSAAPASPASLAPAGVTPRRTVANPAPKSESRLFVILVDDLSFEAGDGKALFVSAERFVSRLPASDYVGYGTTSGAGTVNPTRDRQPVLAALKTAVGQWLSPARQHRDPPIISIGEALLIDGGNNGLVQTIMLRECYTQREAQTMANVSVENLQRMSPCASQVPFRATQIAEQVKAMRTRQLQAIASSVESLRPAPGIKHVVLLSNGLPVEKGFEDLAPVARAAATAGVELSTMIQEGDIDLSDVAGGVEGDIATTSLSDRRRNDNQVLLGGIQTMTDMAGGQFYRVIGQPKRFFDRVDVSASAVYRLGVELPPDTPPGRELAVTARVKRPDVSALASHHAAAPVVEASVPLDERMKNAVQRGETSYGVPIDFGAIVRRSTTPGQLEIGATVRVPAGTDGPLTVLFGFADITSALKSGKRTIQAPAAGDYQTTFTVPVPPGFYSLRLAVADASGHVGSVVMPMQASLATLGPLQASDLLTWVTDAAGRQQLLAFEDVPASVGALTAMVELYPQGNPPSGVEVTFAIVDATSRTVVQKDASVSAGAGLLRADAPLDIQALPAGSYLLRATVSIGGQPAGTLTTTLKKN